MVLIIRQLHTGGANINNNLTRCCQVMVGMIGTCKQANTKKDAFLMENSNHIIIDPKELDGKRILVTGGTGGGMGRGDGQAACSCRSNSHHDSTAHARRNKKIRIYLSKPYLNVLPTL